MVRKRHLAFLPLLLAACTSGEAVVHDTADTADTVDAVGGADVIILSDSAEDSDIGFAPDTKNTADLPPDVGYCEGLGSFGCPCDDNDDCYSGLCVMTHEGKVCTEECVEDCPWGWGCHAMMSGPDLILYCMPHYPYLCHPCFSTTDCLGQVAGTGARCLVYDDGQFCGGPCEAGACPNGYICEARETAEGDLAEQCVGPPAPCQDSNPCTDDICIPFQGCQHLNNTAPCTDGDACSVGDTCADGFCQSGSGAPVCNDGNGCTDDSCVSPGGCHFEPNYLPCDDGNACTVGDTCADSWCHPGPQKDCALDCALICFAFTGFPSYILCTCTGAGQCVPLCG